MGGNMHWARSSYSPLCNVWASCRSSTSGESCGGRWRRIFSLLVLALSDKPDELLLIHLDRERRLLLRLKYILKVVKGYQAELGGGVEPTRGIKFGWQQWQDPMI
ncbi:predicted protein [Histoplasma capsulatum G186AR]|uniref:Uncharacterized protein n=1 Tax=Ajellomyces capsulatus (strain G186AR / H82 / ATCC MYA-2454 / RMSCC 2432) TaxID=447093 RepID=C0NKJ9_AJECG|nr:uncharacterized protein HCBG_03679 [Histoplasma capsulatum G186AR]EEH08390.1 predicted protein [Histoplasma capsulatum G186AR]